jgi:hypothetical protein
MFHGNEPDNSRHVGVGQFIRIFIVLERTGESEEVLTSGDASGITFLIHSLSFL